MRAGTPLSTPHPASRLRLGALSVLAALPASRNEHVIPPSRALSRDNKYQDTERKNGA